MQLNFLLWNTGGKAPDAEIGQLAKDCQAHVVALCEYNGDGSGALRALLAIDSSFALTPPMGCARVKLFTTFPPASMDHGPEADRYTVKQLSPPGIAPLTLCLAHLPSKRNADDVDQIHFANLFKSDIEEGERRFGHTNTIVMGDLNMNPFDDGMTSALGLNAVPCLALASKEKRTIHGKDHHFFYNPSWNLLGDFQKPAGTYFYSSPGTSAHYWHTLDQVIVRPSIAPRFVAASLRIVTTAGTFELTGRNGRPSTSDHLPITFSIDMS
ncbi:endonuclease/exonuclease/phosphatase family protein [Stenotrophomonas lactitubi]|uniref:endonuclease/exonuclease/phosphatase family protein n=1 Tax=Stenotrophomonas lactitubi TaxID=2045214 RepID=UPI0035BFDFFD